MLLLLLLCRCRWLLAAPGALGELRQHRGSQPAGALGGVAGRQVAQQPLQQAKGLQACLGIYLCSTGGVGEEGGHKQGLPVTGAAERTAARTRQHMYGGSAH